MGIGSFSILLTSLTFTLRFFTSTGLGSPGEGAGDKGVEGLWGQFRV